MSNSITPPPHLLKKFSTEARDESNKRNGTGYLKTFAKLCIEWANFKSTSNLSQIRSSEIQPPPELVHQWHKEACKDPYHGGTFFESKTLKHIAAQSAQWGADQELQHCADWVGQFTHSRATDLIDARRPKPPSLKKQALEIMAKESWSTEDE